MLRKILIATASLFALFAIGGSALFFTDTVGAQVEDSAEVAPEGDREGRRRQGRRILTGEEKAAIVADILGISTEELDAAREDGTKISELAEANGVSMDTIVDAIYDASVVKVNELVASEELTAEQGDTILARLELGKLAHDIIDRDVLKQAAADTLGISVEEMAAAKEDGTLQELAEAAGVTREDVKEAVTAARDGMIDEALANGEISAEQAEQLKELSGRKGRSGHGKGNGRAGRGGQGGPNNGAPVETTDA